MKHIRRRGNLQGPVSKKKIFGMSLVAAFISGLCCFSPLVLFLLGLASASLAGSLADTLYYGYKWEFRLAGVIFLAAVCVYWYSKQTKTCPIEERAKLKRTFLNIFLFALLLFFVAYIVWLYVIVEYLGILLNLWNVPDIVRWSDFV
jgi:hypothetical protein